ncbi:MAG: FAD-binding protein [Myxococcota bacterium]|nr:FAD-binding protein [Myxococcota bacterium]
MAPPTHQIELKLPAAVAYDEAQLRQQLRAALIRELRCAPEEVSWFKLIRRSIDARRRPVLASLRVEYQLGGETPAESALDLEQFLGPPRPLKGRVLIVGAGPAGLFAALRLIERGLRPIILERGRPVRERRRDLARLNREGIVDPDSNYCFGEGGAGTYSDGKLYTRSKRRGDLSRVLALLIAHGAPPEIEYEARPHIGTNRLPAVVQAIRETIISWGGEVHFGHRVSELLTDGGRCRGLRLSDGATLEGDAVLLATGHSARDVFLMLDRAQVPILAKPFALGLRIEHPQSLIDQIQYRGALDAKLPSASYRLVTQAAGRGVFSFCMCPGGVIAPAATAPGEVVVNGWSPYKRNGHFANSGIVASVDEQDFDQFERAHGREADEVDQRLGLPPRESARGSLFAGLRFQAALERRAFIAAGGRDEEVGRLKAPGQRLLDFLDARSSTHLPRASYFPGLESAPLHQILPPNLVESLSQGLRDFGARLRGYESGEALLVGVESRTSSPLRIPRNEALEHPSCAGLYPCGEGAGYAGGIMSAALDGVRCAEAIAATSL